uniref:Translation initiation factor IF-1 n=1 Tax=Engelhardia unijuga TaxID=3076540 RepID=A0AA96C7D4_9ROSI|nr:Translation initiation factor IF-1 [Engelhardia unijuga]WNI00674.1 Translation initiation factor IF-1 [Engelhardia roxburghiana]WNI01109.1 Translation initiation factor IF-1 [Engelhardia fenzelii]WNI00761.1 Translation initiation factor IF-1 [Engelhardia roxburghiana]WNI00848.1 Translation initiation factor IF-1 [Engelhardia roxburghiana]WNI00935.1 Translation initiation factor IF-1 [Engelhardia roxburghiana]
MVQERFGVVLYIYYWKIK